MMIMEIVQLFVDLFDTRMNFPSLVILGRYEDVNDVGIGRTD